MPAFINMTPTQVEQERMQNNKVATRQFTFQLFGTTTNATATELFVDAIPLKRLGVPPESAVAYSYVLASFNTTDNTSSGGIGSGAANRTLNTTSLVANSVSTPYPSAGASAVVAVTADDTNDAIAFTVTGTAAKTIFHNIIVTVSVANENRQNPF